MSRLEEIKEAVAQMTPEEVKELFTWVEQCCRKAEEAASNAWDKQIEEDAKAGRLDHFIAEVEESIRLGKVRPLP